MLTELLSWRWVLFVNVPVGAVAVALAPVWLPEQRDPRSRRMDLPGAGLVTGGFLALIYGLSRAESDGWDPLDPGLAGVVVDEHQLQLVPPGHELLDTGVGGVGAGIHLGPDGVDELGPGVEGFLPGLFADLLAAPGEPVPLLRGEVLGEHGHLLDHLHQLFGVDSGADTLVSELAAVGVRASHRRRGVAAAVTAVLTRACRQARISSPFLTPAGDDEERIYRAVGYRDATTMNHISRPD